MPGSQGSSAVWAMLGAGGGGQGESGASRVPGWAVGSSSAPEPPHTPAKTTGKKKAERCPERWAGCWVLLGGCWVLGWGWGAGEGEGDVNVGAGGLLALFSGVSLAPQVSGCHIGCCQPGSIPAAPRPWE